MSTIYVDNIAPKTASGTITITDDVVMGGDLTVTGNYINSIRTETGATYTVNVSDSYIFYNSATPATVTLFTAVGNAGRRIDIKNINDGVVTVEGDGVETIDGISSFVLSSKYDTLTIISDNTQWLIL